MALLRSWTLMFLIGLLLILGVALLVFWLTRTTEAGTDLLATAELVSPSGEPVGMVRFAETESSVVIAAEARGLEPGGHAFAIHTVGTCSPDFGAAGDHFDPDDEGRGFVHPNWDRRDSVVSAHGGDLPNLYASADGTARADFFTNGVTLRLGQSHSLFDSDGSAILIHEKPVDYKLGEGDTGQRVACGVIRPG